MTEGVDSRIRYTLTSQACCLVAEMTDGESGNNRGENMEMMEKKRGDIRLLRKLIVLSRE
jgi:hypothetical protein